MQTLHVFVVKLVKFFLSFAAGFQSSELRFSNGENKVRTQNPRKQKDSHIIG